MCIRDSKIDRSFLSDPNPEVAELTDTIVHLAQMFKLKAVAEGIESSGQVERLQGISCEFGQGFHFAQPLRAEEIMTMAATHATHATPAEEPAPQTSRR